MKSTILTKRVSPLLFMLRLPHKLTPLFMCLSEVKHISTAKLEMAGRDSTVLSSWNGLDSKSVFGKSCFLCSSGAKLHKNSNRFLFFDSPCPMCLISDKYIIDFIALFDQVACFNRHFRPVQVSANVPNNSLTALHQSGSYDILTQNPVDSDALSQTGTSQEVRA